MKNIPLHKSFLFLFFHLPLRFYSKIHYNESKRRVSPSGKVMVCGTIMRGFDSRHPPLYGYVA